METLEKKKPWKVLIIESEAGWGNRIDERVYFDSEEEAKNYVKNYNHLYNSEEKVPSWYMKAEGPYQNT